MQRPRSHYGGDFFLHIRREWGIMTATRSLQDQAEALTHDVLSKINELGGEISGSMTQIRQKIGMGGSNNLIRVTLGHLCQSKLLIGTPLDSISIGMPTKAYLYKLSPKAVLLLRLEEGRIDRCGTADDYVELLELNGRVTPSAFDELLKDLILSRKIKAPITALANDHDRPRDAYLYLERAA